MVGQEIKKGVRNKYPRQLKIKIAEEVVTGLKGVMEASRDYNLSKDRVIDWVKKFRNQILAKEAKESLPLSTMQRSQSRGENDLKKKVRELEEENMRLRKDLHDTKLKAEVLNKMIEIAERTYGIGIRKKSGAKQSKK